MDNQRASIALIAVLTLAMSTLIPETTNGAQSKGGKAGAHVSRRGKVNTNAQWSADPEKGWVRAQERDQVRDERSEKPKKNRDKHKGDGANKGRKN